MSGKKWWIAGLVIVVAAGSAGGYWWLNKTDKQLGPSYMTTQVRRGTIEVKVSGTGSIQAAAKETLKATSAGKVAKVNAKSGDKVKKGDILVTFEQEDVSNQIRSKKIDLQKKKLELEDLQAKYKEADDETRDGMVLNIEKQQLDIEVAAADLADLQDGDEIEPIVAPIDGTLSDFEVDAGDTLNPNSELGTIADRDHMQIVVGVDELDIPKVKVGQEAEILVDALPEQKYAGRVVAIADEGTSSNGVASFDVTVRLTDIKDLKVGMSAQADIMTASKSNVLMLPIDAVQSARGSYYVMVPGTGNATTASTGVSGQGTQGGLAQRSEQGAQGAQGEQGTRGTQGTQSTQGAQGTQDSQGTSGQAAQGSSDGQAGTGRRGSFGGGGGFQNMTEEQREAMRAQFENMTDEERTAMREQFAGGGAGAVSNGANAASGGSTTVTTTSRVNVEVGINNEDYIEIVSGLKEGDLVVLPTATGTSGSNNRQQGFGGFGAGGVIPGGGGFAIGEFSRSGGFQGGGQRTGGGTGTSGGGGR